MGAPKRMFDFCAAFVCIIAALAAMYPDVALVFMPLYVDAYAVRLFYSRSRTNADTATNLPPLVTDIIPESIQDLGEIFSASGRPKVVRGFLSKQDPDTVVKLMSDANAGQTMRMLNFENYTDHHLSTSCHIVNKYPRVDKKFDEYATDHLYTHVAHQSSHLYAGFEAITDIETINKVAGVDLRGLGDYKQNNLFASNFHQGTMSAGMHCAPIDSVVLQIAGYKDWYFASPESLAKIPNIPMPTAFNLPMTDEEVLSQIGEFHVARTGPGDLLYFGPHWCHAVWTEGGPNLMLNMRYFNKKLIRTGPKSLFFKLVVRKMLHSFGRLPQENADHFPLIFDDLNAWYDDCGPSPTLEKMLNKTRELACKHDRACH